MNFEQSWFNFMQELLVGKKKFVANLMITAYQPKWKKTPFYENLMIEESTPPANPLSMALQFRIFFVGRPEQIVS